jgi:hypothetical protein
MISENDGASWAGVGVLAPRELAGASSGCSGDEHAREAADTWRALGRQLAQLPQSTVTQALTPAEAFGYHTLHLRLRVDASCPGNQFYRVAEAIRDFGITWSHDPGQVVMDIWVLDVGDTPIMVASWHEQDASSDLVDKVTRVRDSITFVTAR